MLNKIDKVMLGVLLALPLVSLGIHYQDADEAAVASEPVAVAEVETLSVLAIPDFASMVDVKAKKRAFFGFLLPIVQQENDTILQHRQRIIALSSLSALTEQDQSWLADMGRKYRLPDIATFDARFFAALLSRVDTIPASLALAQSANESAWGTSRFARQGNNFFGQWCFTPGCGIVPAARPAGETYEVQMFEDVAASVRAYMHNLNTNHQYQAMRQIREQRRISQESVTGADLAHGLQAYSIRGKAYIEELLSMINSNKLLQYDVNDPG
ncbi:glucosaminidase domain-containing protein [Endozoicomonas sp. SCSIO W0465]|uniref:glucosaminidase domain-containing protein n=1 Tax=Endozoicomonas sp. SCSIO W0465 TaxID=2918516 RepID=UPI002075EBAF|nr:glucosaminidase domain-containing protein [Endozoicomonas sp. SCSIO W0465]USE34942.1 glucosaminidase domain-containing protein [Endozoicomonas sp. SCSIO W0465]